MISEFLSRFNNVKPVPSKRGEYRCTCPNHGSGNNTGLKIFDHGDKLGVYCHAGCDYEEILSAVGLKPGDLYENKITLEDRRSIAADFRTKRQKETKQHQLYVALCTIKQCLESRMYSGEPEIENLTDAWDQEKQAVRRLPSLLNEYYK